MLIIKSVIVRTWILPILILIAGCASISQMTGMKAPSLKRLIQADILRPAEITLPGIKTIAVADFATAPEIDPNVGSEFAKRLRVRFIENDHFNTVAGWRLNQIIADEGFAEKGFLNSEHFQTVGQKIGADGILFGTIDNYDYRDSSYSGLQWVDIEKPAGHDPITGVTKFVVTKEKMNAYTMIRKVKVAIDLRVIDCNTGKELFTYVDTTFIEDNQWERIRKKRTESILDVAVQVGQLVGVVKTPEEKAAEAAFAKLLSPKVLFYQAFDSLENGINPILSSYSTEIYDIEAGRHPLLISGYDFARLNDWEEAKKSWQSIIEDNEASEYHSKAWYNLGIYYEYHNVLDKAEECYNEAHLLDMKEKSYLNAISRIVSRKKEAKKLVKQGLML